MENNICKSLILTSRRRHFYLVGQSKHKVGACGVNNQASAVLAGNELLFVAFSVNVSCKTFHISLRGITGEMTDVSWKLNVIRKWNVNRSSFPYGAGMMLPGCGEDSGDKGLFFLMERTMSPSTEIRF
ncbi:hypothetical protein TNCV_3647071 [Trichonephila clavipes]|nr:hypothetical protein TNCV_3647071 [Trichonephila clavipes]